MIKLERLPFKANDLKNFLTEETITYHYGKHHQNYVNNLNKLIKNTINAKKTLIEIIQTEKEAIFNNAAQIFNHTFYWKSLSNTSTLKLISEINNIINMQYGSFKQFKNQFNKQALSLFGSGWIWLIYNDHKINIQTTHNAGCPIQKQQKPLLCLDVWEHAYYIDYRNDRLKYLQKIMKLLDWQFAANNAKL